MHFSFAQFFAAFTLLLTYLIPADAYAAQHPLWADVAVMFPQASHMGEFEGEPPIASVYADSQLQGYVFLTNDIVRIPAYSGKPINTLVGFDLTGLIRGTKIIEHEEPILVIGITEKRLQRYTDQYAGLQVTDDIRVGGSASPGKPVIDAISGATITVMVINRTVSLGLKKVVAARELLTQEVQRNIRIEAPPEPLWISIWEDRVWDILILSLALFVLLFILLFQDWLARHPTMLVRVRTGYLIFTLVFIGWLGFAQLSVVNVLTFIHALLQKFSWEGFLLDPMLFLLWSFVAMTLVLWGRGVYCGWLCPFGALQELSYRLAKVFKVPDWEPPALIHERLLALKYLILLALFGISLQSLGQAEIFAEVEPFKTVFALRFGRSLPFVIYAVLLVVAGFFVRKAFCRYLCPLGAALTFPSRFRIFDWLRRRKECGRPCQTCYRECEVRAIQPTGEINEVECHYCLDCQVTYWDDHKCPPLVEQRKKAERRARYSTNAN